MKYKLLFIVLSLVLWIGCYEEEPLTPSQGLEYKYTVPQGDHDFDVKIVDWYEKNGFYILYKFDPKDIYFNVSYWTGILIDSLTGNQKGDIASSVAEEEYVGRQLQLMEDVFLNFYSDTVLNTWMPMKLLLCSKLENRFGTKQAAVGGLDFIAVRYGSAEIEELLADDDKIITFKNALNELFIQRLIDQQKLVAPKEFTELSTYGKKVVEKDMYALGFVERSSSELKAEVDFRNYIRAILSYSYAELTADTEDGDYTMIGILTPKKDTKGLIRKKYDIVTKYFRDSLHMDLQAIGNYMK